MKRSFIKSFCLIVCIISSAVIFFGCQKECNHASITETIVEPTHEKQGYTVHHCPDCDYEYETDFVPPTGHTIKQEITPPTCTEQGFTYNYCDCGYHFTSDYVPPLGHTLSIEETSPSCDHEGYKTANCGACGLHYTFDIVPPLGHELSVERTFVSVNNPSASSTYTCGRCDLNYTGDHVFYHDIYKGAYVENTQKLSKGLDVSYHQHDTDENGQYLPLDWASIKAAGYDFVILRAGYMDADNVGVVDKVFEMNYADARAAGLDIGVYLYSYAYSIEDAKAEAEFLLTLLEGKTFEYPIFFDIEYSDETIEEKQLTPNDLTDICIEFISILQENGYYAALYSNNDWLTEKFITEKVTTLFDIWYARYLYNAASGVVVSDADWNTEKYGRQMAMWQFTETGTIDGIYYSKQKNDDGTPKLISFDMNYSYKDYPTIIKSLGLNGFTVEKDLSTTDEEKQPDTNNA